MMLHKHNQVSFILPGAAPFAGDILRDRVNRVWNVLLLGLCIALERSREYLCPVLVETEAFNATKWIVCHKLYQQYFVGLYFSKYAKYHNCSVWAQATKKSLPGILEIWSSYSAQSITVLWSVHYSINNDDIVIQENCFCFVFDR